jgi:hypothetical protein
MSLDPKYNKHHAPEILEELQNLDRLDAIATAAGHGYASVGLKHNAGWVEVEIDPKNVRPSYDRLHIETFSPELIQAMLFELSELRKQVAAQ